MKRILLTLVLGVMLISFVSAYYGSYSSFSLSDLLDSIDSSTMILGAVFIISFALVNFALVRVFRDNKATAGIVAFVVSLLITYGINRTGFDLEGLFYGIGLSEGFLYAFLPFVLLAGVIYLIIKLKTKALFIIGGLFILISFTELIYEKGITLVIGVVLIGIGFWLWQRKKKLIGHSYRESHDPKIIRANVGGITGRSVWNNRPKYDWEKEKSQAKAIGRGVTWTGRKAKVLAQKEWQKEKDIMKERAEKLKQKKDEFVQRKKEKLFLEFNRFKKEITQIDNQLSKLDQEKNYNYINNLKWKRDKLYKKAKKITDKLRKLGYPI